MAGIMDVGERFAFLDDVATIAREPLASKSMDAAIESLMNSVGISTVKWDVVLRMGNRWYDQIADASRNPTRAERDRAFGRIGADINMDMAVVRNWKATAASRSAGHREAVSRQIGLIFIALTLPTIPVAMNAEDRVAMQFKLTELALSLAAYRADYGTYPAKLPNLVPKYIAAVPKDIFNKNAELHYKRERGGYLLYSIGVNGKDNGGKGSDNRKNDEDWDDLVIHVPAIGKQ